MHFDFDHVMKPDEMQLESLDTKYKKALKSLETSINLVLKIHLTLCHNQKNVNTNIIARIILHTISN